jgi:hypothetical protein
MSRAVGWVATVLTILAVASVAAADVFNETEGKKALTDARIRAADCSRVSGVTGPGKIKVTIGNAGQVTEMTFTSVPPKMDAPTDACIRAEFQKIRVTPFEGNTVIVSGGFVLL